MRTARTQDVIVGSGAGGGVLAQRLAAAGRAVVLLEEGPEVGKADFNQRESDMYDLLHRDAGGQATANGAIAVLQGRCLGGSTTINMGDCVPIEEAVLDHWRQHFGWGDWGGISNDDVAAAARAVMADMGAGPIPPELVNRANGLLRAGAEKLGLQGSVLLHNRVGCTGSGYCLIGCSYDAKRGTLVSHIPDARAAGCQLMCDSRVDRVVREGDRAVAVEGAGFRVECERVFLCAGAIHTCGILARSALQSGGLGRHLSLQPQAPIVALFDEDVVFFRGVPQSYGVDGFLSATAEGGLGGYTVEGVATGPAMAASMIPGDMAQLRSVMSRYRQMAASLCLVPDRPSGVVKWGKRPRPTIQYDHDPVHLEVMRESLRTAARCYLAAGAKEVIPTGVEMTSIRSEADLGLIDHVSLRPCDQPMISAHPQGTCRMAGEEHDPVVGLDFKVRGTANVYVCDASLFPTTSSTHTMVPVMSMAHLLAASLT